MPIIISRCRWRWQDALAERSRAASISVIRITRRSQTCCSQCWTGLAFRSKKSVTVPTSSWRSKMRPRPLLTSIALLGLPAFAATAADTRLVEAVKSGDRAAALALIAAKADVNTPEVDGTTPLHWAVHQSDVELVERLIRSGARA